MKADDTVPAATSSWMTLAGYGLTGVSALFFLMDAGMKLMQLPIVLQTTAQLGWPTSSVVPLGMILLVSTLLYIFPRTSILGAVLLTGYLGAPSQRTRGSTAHCSRIPCSASTSVSSFGRGCICAILFCARCSRRAAWRVERIGLHRRSCDKAAPHLGRQRNPVYELVTGPRPAWTGGCERRNTTNGPA